jgi:hypothetical protein
MMESGIMSPPIRQCAGLSTLTLIPQKSPLGIWSVEGREQSDVSGVTGCSPSGERRGPGTTAGCILLTYKQQQ